ncbi:hypothetical protein Tco_0175157 [Tanacetum coccineum]
MSASPSQDEIPPPPPPPSSQTPTQQTPHTVPVAITTIHPVQIRNHLPSFHKMTDAKEMWDAIKSRFGGNDESKKMQKYILKQQFEGFSVVTTEDANQKVPKSLLSAVVPQVSLIMRTKPGETRGGDAVEFWKTRMGAEPAKKEDSNSLKMKINALMSLQQLQTLTQRHIPQGLKKVEAQLVAHKQDNFGNYMPSGPDVEVDDSKFTYGPKQTQPNESETQTSEIDTCESNISAEPSELVSEPVVNESNDYPHRALQNKRIVDSGCSRHMTGNKAYLDEFQDFNGGPVAFGGSRGYITGKGKIKTGELDFEDVCFVKELQHFNLFSVSQICDKKNKVLFNLTPEWDSDKEDESAQDCFVLPIWPSYSSTITPALTTDDKREGPREEEKGAAKPSSTNIFSTVSTPAKASSTNLVNTVSIPVSTLSNPNEGLSLSDPTNPEEDDSEIPPLEDIYQNPPIPPTSLADFTNLETVVNVSPIPTSRIHSTHPKALILGDPNSAVQTRSKVNKSSGAHAFVSYVQKQKRTNHKDFHHCLFACFLSQHEPKKISEALEDESWVDAMQEELLQFEIQKVWVLVDLPYRKKAIGTKWVYRNKKDERGVVVRNKASLSNGMAKSALHYGKIDEEYIVSTTLRIVPMLEQTLTGKSTTGGFQFLAETHSWSMQKANIQCGYFYLQRQKYVATEGKSVDTKSMLDLWVTS